MLCHVESFSQLTVGKNNDKDEDDTFSFWKSSKWMDRLDFIRTKPYDNRFQIGLIKDGSFRVRSVHASNSSFILISFELWLFFSVIVVALTYYYKLTNAGSFLWTCFKRAQIEKFTKHTRQRWKDKQMSNIRAYIEIYPLFLHGWEGEINVFVCGVRVHARVRVQQKFFFGSQKKKFWEEKKHFEALHRC